MFTLRPESRRFSIGNSPIPHSFFPTLAHQACRFAGNCCRTGSDRQSGFVALSDAQPCASFLIQTLRTVNWPLPLAYASSASNGWEGRQPADLFSSGSLCNITSPETIHRLCSDCLDDGMRSELRFVERIIIHEMPLWD